MAPGFIFKSRSPSRTSLLLSAPSTSNDLRPGSGGKSPTNTSMAPYSKEETFKLVKNLEEVLSAWNEYRLSLTAAGKAGKKLAGALKDLVGCACVDKGEVPAQTVRPSAVMVDTTSELLTKLSKRVDAAYEGANTSASKYFNILANQVLIVVVRQKESRSHEAYLSSMTESFQYPRGGFDGFSTLWLIALKTSLSEDIARANADQSMILGAKQTSLLLQVSSAVGLMSSNITSYFSDGLRKAGALYADVEYFRALADIQWQGSLPFDLDEKEEERRRGEIRLIKTRVALGEMDVVGKQVWSGDIWASGASTPLSPNLASTPGQPSTQAQHIRKWPAMSDNGATHGPQSTRTPAVLPTSASLPTTSASAALSTSTSTAMSSARGPLPGPSSRPNGVRPLQVQNRHVSVPSGLVTPARKVDIPPLSPLRRSVSEIAAEMETRAAAVGSNREVIEAHRRHGTSISGCALCYSDDQERIKAKETRGVRRVTMPPAYSQPFPIGRSGVGDGLVNVPGRGEEAMKIESTRADRPKMSESQHKRASFHSLSSMTSGLLSPTPRRVTGTSPDFPLEETSF